ncbi:protein of unknown function DUF559 [Vibrio phage 1.090.B._10N.286.48.F1]|nr:protein of unknown function DUF559 [Vibrio phage 1.090.B._10N.286.48.F1]
MINYEYALAKCGYSTSAVRVSFSREVKKRGLTEGVDYMVTPDISHKKAGQRKMIYMISDDVYREMKESSKNFIRPYKVREEAALSTIEQVLSISLIREYKVGRYRVDGYHKETNTVYEIDEEHHKRQKKEDMNRQEYIESKIGCKFVRIEV